jgi:hypothetical protein
MSDSYKYISYKVDTVNFNTSNIKSKSYEVNNTPYTILNNNTTTIQSDETLDDTTRLYRSIIVNPENNKILCFSPPNSIPFDSFESKNKEFDQNSIFANEIVEGTMINLFYDERINSWEISTRGAIGGNYWYYRTNYEDVPAEFSRQITFREMFMDALKLNSPNLNESIILQDLPKDCCYSFVLQHPDNHIVLSISQPKLYLVSIYKLEPVFDSETNGVIENNVVLIPPSMHKTVINEITKNVFNIPHHYTEYSSYSDIKNKVCSGLSSHTCMGVMFTNLNTGERSSIENTSYEQVKELRGNNPNLQYQYFCLLRCGKKSQFLLYFPRYRSIFSQFNKQYNDFITNVHQSYFSYYVKKQGIPISKKYFIHASKIHHNIFLPKLSTEKIVVTRNIVKEYFDSLSPNELLYYLNYDKRQLNKEISKLEESLEKLITN